MDGFLAFGDVFVMGDKEYVYLGIHEDIVYAARICEPRHTEQMLQRYEELQASGTSEAKLREHVLFCFVILSTEEFNGRAAHFGQPTTNIRSYREGGCCLNEEDIEKLKAEIQSSRGAPRALKAIIENL